MIQELARSAWSVLESYEAQISAKLMDRTEAEAHAISRLRMMRYGSEGKDYFWINDLHPYMVMHPYRTDLVGLDLSDIRDARGKYLFKEFVRIASREKEGYVDYYWQWKDDAERISKKLSYVKLFEPWGWIVGTGVYIDDIDIEIKHIRGHLIQIGGSVFLVLLVLAGYIMKRGLDIEKERVRLEENLRLLATSDPLTGASNRRHFWELSNQEVLRHKRYRHPMAVFVLDVDKFKSVNDIHGHPVGDKVLLELVQNCAASLRKSDIFGRIGGEEFAAVLVETSEPEAQVVAERIRRNLSRLRITTDNAEIQFTVSIGMSNLKGNDETIDDLLKRADKALYKAKKNGRNQTAVA